MSAADVPTTEQAAAPKEGEAGGRGRARAAQGRGDKGGDKAAATKPAADKADKKDKNVIRLVVGLGNPGKEYERTRHNAGFWLVERFAQASGVTLRKDPKFKALVGKNAGRRLVPAAADVHERERPAGADARRLLPASSPRRCWWCTTSSTSRPASREAQAGRRHRRPQRPHGHLAALGSQDFWRLRIGIGHPGDKDAVADYVLQKPRREEKEAIDQAIDRALQVLPRAADAATCRPRSRSCIHGDPKPSGEEGAAEEGSAGQGAGKEAPSRRSPAAC